MEAKSLKLKTKNSLEEFNSFYFFALRFKLSVFDMKAPIFVGNRGGRTLLGSQSRRY